MDKIIEFIKDNEQKIEIYHYINKIENIFENMPIIELQKMFDNKKTDNIDKIELFIFTELKRRNSEIYKNWKIDYNLAICKHGKNSLNNIPKFIDYFKK